MVTWQSFKALLQQFSWTFNRILLLLRSATLPRTCKTHDPPIHEPQRDFHWWDQTSDIKKPVRITLLPAHWASWSRGKEETHAKKSMLFTQSCRDCNCKAFVAFVWKDGYSGCLCFIGVHRHKGQLVSTKTVTSMRPGSLSWKPVSLVSVISVRHCGKRCGQRCSFAQKYTP